MALGLKGGASPAGPASGVKELFHDDYVTLLVDEPRKLVRLVRSAKPFPDLLAPERTYATLIALCAALDRPRYSLLTDLRLAPGRNDPAFEALMQPLRARLQVGFARRGTLVATAIGAMQVRRLTREDGIERLISTEEAELLDYLKVEPPDAKPEARPGTRPGAKSG